MKIIKVILLLGIGGVIGALAYSTEQWSRAKEKLTPFEYAEFEVLIDKTF